MGQKEEQLERARPSQATDHFIGRVAPVLAVCYQAMMDVPCERRLAEQHGVTLQRFLYHFRDAHVIPILVGKERVCAGAMWFKDGEVHLAISRQFRGGQWVKRLKDLLAPGFKRNGGKLSARINKGNLVARRFTEKVGGKRVGEDELAILYELTEDGMRYAA